jgi:uncharacterized protein YjbI with pentapeptide repeats
LGAISGVLFRLTVANPEHLSKVKEGVEVFNQWRTNNPETKLDLSRANLVRANLIEANLDKANLNKADLSEANLRGANLRAANLIEANLLTANLRGADLSWANLSWAHLGGANLREANLSGAKLGGANLTATDLREANLSGAYLSRATLISTNLGDANLTSCSVYGISAWNVHLKGATQSNLVITPEGESAIQVDNLEVAQFIYLLLNNAKIRDVIDTITSKVVLILGRFTPERKSVLDAIREELRRRNYLPVLFDFEKPASRNFTETVSTLAHMARFVIADLTDPRSIPQELTRIIPLLPSVPVKPLLLASQQEYGMFTDFRAYPWVLEPYRYATEQTLLAELDQMVIAPAEAKAKELTRK